MHEAEKRIALSWERLWALVDSHPSIQAARDLGSSEKQELEVLANAHPAWRSQLEIMMDIWADLEDPLWDAVPPVAVNDD